MCSTADKTYKGLVQYIVIGLMELCFFLDLQKRKNSNSNNSKA